jgi:hypothetical protein
MRRRADGGWERKKGASERYARMRSGAKLKGIMTLEIRRAHLALATIQERREAMATWFNCLLLEVGKGGL